MNLGHRLRIARLKRGYSLRELGSLIGISAPSISAWETGKANPTFENLSTVADLLAISFEWLCTGKGDMDLIVYEEIPLFEKMSAEWQANNLGAAILMPRSIVIKYFDDPYGLMNHCGCSYSSALYRIKNVKKSSKLY